MATSVTNHFDELNDRFSTYAAKFHPDYLFDIFSTDELYPFWIADQDFKSPPAVINALVHRANNGIYGYEYKPAQFKNIVKKWYWDQFQCVIKEDWMVHTPTIMSSMAMAVDLFTQSSDKVIIQPPVYKEFSNVLNKTERTAITNPLVLKENKYQIDFDQLKELAKKDNVTALMLCNPHNPAGRVWTRQELQQVVNIALENNLLIISDEIHADIVFSNGQFHSLLSFPEIQQQLVVCYSPAKVFNIASISDSLCLIPNRELRMKFDSLRDRYNMGRTNAFSQVAWMAGFSHGASWVKELNQYLERNVTYIHEFVKNQIPEISCVKQEGTYLVWMDVSKLNIQGEELIQYLAKNAQVGLTDGAVFGKEGTHFVRMNISCPFSIIKQAMDSLRDSIHQI